MNEYSASELEKLQDIFVRDEKWFEKELDSAKRMIGQQPEKKTQPAAPAAPVRNYANGYGADQVQTRLRQPVAAEKEPPMPKPRGIRGLLILAMVELAGILGIGAWWALYLLP